jgi:hypothetical protein
VHLPVNKSVDEIQREFNNHLARVYDRGAHMSGTEGCLQMINDYSNDAEIATIFIRSLTDNFPTLVAKEEPGKINFQSMSFHATLFGYMGVKFRLNLIDLKKEPTVAKTVLKIVNSMKELFFD